MNLEKIKKSVFSALCVLGVILLPIAVVLAVGLFVFPVIFVNIVVPLINRQPIQYFNIVFTIIGIIAVAMFSVGLLKDSSYLREGGVFFLIFCTMIPVAVAANWKVFEVAIAIGMPFLIYLLAGEGDV